MIELLKNLYASAVPPERRVTPPIFFDGIPNISYGTTYPSLQRNFGRANRLWLTIPMSTVIAAFEFNPIRVNTSVQPCAENGQL